MPHLAIAVAHIVVFVKDSVFMFFMNKAKSAAMRAKLQRHKLGCKEQVFKCYSQVRFGTLRKVNQIHFGFPVVPWLLFTVVWSSTGFSIR